MQGMSGAMSKTKIMVPANVALGGRGSPDYLIEIVGFLTGMCLGALGCKRSEEPTRTKRLIPILRALAIDTIDRVRAYLWCAASCVSYSRVGR
jgi:hypothetical protein